MVLLSHKRCEWMKEVVSQLSSTSPNNSNRRFPKQKCSIMWYISVGFCVAILISAFPHATKQLEKLTSRRIILGNDDICVYVTVYNVVVLPPSHQPAERNERPRMRGCHLSAFRNRAYRMPIKQCSVVGCNTISCVKFGLKSVSL